MARPRPAAPRSRPTTGARENSPEARRGPIYRAPEGGAEGQRPGRDKSGPYGPGRPSFFSPVVRGPQSLIMPGMVAAGCWLMAFTLFFLSTDPNRSLFGAMAVLMALLWSFSVGMRVRRLMAQRQKL